MKNLFLIICTVLFVHYDTIAQTEFELEPYQSMSITGKGPGQDAAKNPFDGQDCYAIVENIGKGEFSIRTQQDGKIIETAPLKRGEKLKVKLLKGYELYFDASSNDKIKAKVEFEEMAE